MTGFGVDPDALRGAVNKLKGIRQQAMDLRRGASRVQPGELIADDPYTAEARRKIQERATGENGSLTMVAKALADKLTEKIDAYEATLREYSAADDHATVGHRNVDRQA